MQKQKCVHIDVNMRLMSPTNNVKSSILCWKKYQTCLPHNDIIMKLLWNYDWAQGQTTPHCYFCTNKCQCFLLFLLIDWLDFIDNGTWHLLWLKFVGNLISALQWKVKWSYHKIRRYKLWIKPSTHAQWWAILGYTNLLLFLLVKYLRECWCSEVYLAFLIVTTFNSK